MELTDIPIVRYAETDSDERPLKPDDFRGVPIPAQPVWWIDPDLGRVNIGIGYVRQRADEKGLDATLVIVDCPTMHGRSWKATPGIRRTVDGPPMLSAIYLQQAESGVDAVSAA